MKHCLLIIFHGIFVRHEFNDQHDEPLFLFPEFSGFIPFKRVPSAICQTEDRCPVHVAVRCSCCFPTWRLRRLACQRALHCQNAKRTDKIDPGNGGFPIYRCIFSVIDDFYPLVMTNIANWKITI